MTLDNDIDKIVSILKKEPSVGLGYVFGSRLDRPGPASDHDIAVYLDAEPKDLADIRFSLLDKLTRTLGTDEVDLVILNTAQGPDLKYSIIKDGRLVFQREDFPKVNVETRIMNEYFDFNQILSRHGLTEKQI